MKLVDEPLRRRGDRRSAPANVRGGRGEAFNEFRKHGAISNKEPSVSVNPSRRQHSARTGQPRTRRNRELGGTLVSSRGSQPCSAARLIILSSTSVKLRQYVTSYPVSISRCGLNATQEPMTAMLSAAMRRDPY